MSGTDGICTPKIWKIVWYFVFLNLLAELMWVHNIASLDKNHIDTTKRQVIKLNQHNTLNQAIFQK